MVSELFGAQTARTSAFQRPTAEWRLDAFGFCSVAVTLRNALSKDSAPRSRRALARRGADAILRSLRQPAVMRSEQSPVRRLHPPQNPFGAADADRLFALAERPNRLGRQVAHAVQVLRDALDRYG